MISKLFDTALCKPLTHTHTHTHTYTYMYMYPSHSLHYLCACQGLPRKATSGMILFALPCVSPPLRLVCCPCYAYYPSFLLSSIMSTIRIYLLHSRIRDGYGPCREPSIWLRGKTICNLGSFYCCCLSIEVLLPCHPWVRQ